MSILTFETQNQYKSCTNYDAPVYKIWCPTSKGLARYWVVSTFLCPVWPLNFDLKTHKGYQFFKMYSVQSLMSVKERFLEVLSCQYIHISSLTPWPLNLKIWSGQYTFHDVQVYKVWSLSNRGSRYWVVSIFLCLVWPFDLLTSKSIMVIYFSWCTSLQSLKSVKQRVLNMLSSPYTQMSSLTLWTSKSIVANYFLWCISLQSLKSVKQRVLKILSGQNIPISR
jgi:hypothetical protein